MTDVLDHAAERAERLARLRERRAAGDPPAVAPEGATAPPRAFLPPTLPPGADERSATPSAGRGVRRRSPAATAKIVTVGASTTAVLGMMAGYGIADRAAAMGPTLVPDTDLAADPTPAPPAVTVPLAAPDTTASPQVIVVMIDGATGRPIPTTDLASVLTGPPEGSPTGSAAPVGTAAVPSPVAVDLAVPAPPPPPAPRPAPQPAPHASSGGS